jgi:aspartate/methionine/tyrosine aminotransferase
MIGPYAWIKSHDDNINIAELLLHTYGIEVYSGVQFGSTINYARLSLICDSNDFDNAIKRLL